jgi:hypothetical protein
MASFDRLMIDPSAGQIAAALIEAEKTANKGCQVGLLRTEPAEYANFAAGMLLRPEGVSRWFGRSDTNETTPLAARATHVGVAWWSDYLARKHFRVFGRRLEPVHALFESHRFGPFSADFDRPPLWLVYPHRTVLRTMPGRPRELLLHCDCGVVGTPESIGWMGESCGPCYDRREETGRPAVLPILAHLFHQTAVWEVAVSEDGKHLVTVDNVGSVHFVERATGLKVTDALNAGAQPQRGIEFGANGRMVGLAGYVGRRVWDFKGKRLHESSESNDGGILTGFAISPSGEALVDTGTRGLRLWEGPGRNWQEVFHEQREDAGCCVAFSPDEEFVAEGQRGGHLLLLDRTSDPPAVEVYPLGVGVSDAVRTIAFHPDGDLIAVGTGNQKDLTDESVHILDGEVGLFDRLEERYETLGRHEGWVTSIAVSPDGTVVASVGTDWVVKLWDLAGRREITSLEWHIGPVLAVAFSPDGETLATGSADGVVKLWPWRDLIVP